LRQETAPLDPTRFSRIARHPAVAALYAIAVVVCGFAAVRAVVRAHGDRMWLRTGAAQWIWYSSGGKDPAPLRFYATRDVALSERPAAATAKVFVDREHVLYVNGVRAGGGTQNPGDPLRVYAVAALLELGINRIAIEASSPTGVGGVLFSMDVDGFGRDAVVSDGLWRVSLAPESVASGGRYRPIVWGRPPRFPWGYPRMPRPNEMGP